MEMIEFFKTIVLLLESIDKKMTGIFGSESPAEQLAMEEFDVDKLFTRMMVVAKLGISERTYSRWVKGGVLVPIEVGNKHFYREDGLRDALRKSINKGLI
jgi:hypothetical protein